MALQGIVAVVTGGSGIVGGGIARRFLEEGAVVVAPLRSQASRAKLLEALQGAKYPASNLHTPLADWGTESGAAALAEYLRAEAGGIVDHVVSICGSMAPPGAATELDPGLVLSAVHDKLAGHILLARHTLPLLREDSASSYTVVTGMLGEIMTGPKVAARAICNCAVYGLVVALLAERQASAYRINEMRIGAAICRDSETHHPNFPEYPAHPASKIGHVALGIAKGTQRSQVLRVRPEDLA